MKKRKKKKLRKTRKKAKSRSKKKLKKRSIRRRKARKRAKTAKSLLKKLDVDNLLGSIKPRLKFNFKGFLKRLVSPLTSKIQDYKRSRERLKLKQKKEAEKEQKLQSSLRTQLLKKEIKEEKALAKTRTAELKSFLKEEQKAIREKEKEKEQKFLEEIKLEKTLERFRARELDEINKLQLAALKFSKENYKELELRINNIRSRYRDLRNERLRKRVEELGVTLSDNSSIEEIKRKEKEYLALRELIETSLESFIRSATSLVYQINKRYLPKNADLLRVINRVYEESQIIVREDQESNENFLILIALNSKREIVVTDKIKQETREYKHNAIFKFGDDTTDSLILYLERIRERMKKAS